MVNALKLHSRKKRLQACKGSENTTSEGSHPEKRPSRRPENEQICPQKIGDHLTTGNESSSSPNDFQGIC